MEQRHPRDQQAPICRFCAIVREDVLAERAVALPNGSQAVASLGALVPGWTLVLSQTHESSAARLSPHERSDLFADAEAVREFLSRRLGKAVAIFEHGAIGPTSPTACTTAHVHLHVVPVDGSAMRTALKSYPLKVEWADSGPSDLGAHSADEYLLFSDVPGRFVAALLPQPVSQYFRKVMASLYGRPEEWNWRDWPQSDNVALTQDLLDDLTCDGFQSHEPALFS